MQILTRKKAIVQNLLSRFEKKVLVLKDSIRFNEEYNSYFFEYSEGGEASILLEGFPWSSSPIM